MDSAQVTTKLCFQCDKENPPEQSYCGYCGAALVLKDYISGQVAKELTSTIRDRDVLETDSAVKVFERALRWARLTFGVFTGAVGLVLAVVLTLSGWRASDFLKTVDIAKRSVTSSADSTRNEIRNASAQSVIDIQKESRAAIDANRNSATEAIKLTQDLKNTASQTKTELRGEATSVKMEVANSKSELEAAKKLQPDFDQMRSRLAQTTSELDAQRKKISSAEEFVKEVIGTHVSYTYTFGASQDTDSNTISNPGGNPDSVVDGAIAVKNKDAAATVVYILVPYRPIEGSLQLQFKYTVEPPNTYFVVQNLIVFFWGDPPEGLDNIQFHVSFFPDKTDKDLIKSIVLRNGRIFADGEPMPKYRMEDPDFKGNKWIPAPQPPAIPAPVPKKIPPESTDVKSPPAKG